MKDLEVAYCEYHGWKKKKGIMVNTEMIDTDYEKYFISSDQVSDFISEGEFWCCEEYDDEGVFEDCDIIEHIEDHTTLTFKEWRFKIPQHKNKHDAVHAKEEQDAT